MATWNTDKPALANQVSADIPDIEENLQELHDVITAITNGTLGTTAPASFEVDVIADTEKLTIVPRGHLAGLQMSNDTDTDHDILIAIGEATDSTGAINMKLSTAMTKQIDATWALGDDAGGMNDGDAVGNSEWFHVHELSNAAGDSVDAGYDTSLTAVNLLADTAVIAAGLTLYRRIGSVLTDGSANILAFSQEGDEVLWADPPLDIDVSNQSTTAITRTLSVATGIKVHAIMNVAAQYAGLRMVYFSSLDANDELPSATTAPLATWATEANTTFKLIVRTNTSGQIRTRATDVSTIIRIATLGYVDRRGKDD